MSKNAYSYLPVSFIMVLLVVNGYLFYIASEYKAENRKLILENDSLFSVNHKLINAAVESKEANIHLKASSFIGQK